MRFEHKYVLTRTQYLAVRMALKGFTKPDQFTLAGTGKGYFVRSLYFDTSDYLAYSEKMTGEYGRNKLRIRTYFEDEKDCSFISLEIKSRFGNQIHKNSTHLPYEALDLSRNDLGLPMNENQVIDEFLRLKLLRNQSPKVLVDYYREALTPRDNSDFRITMDTDMVFTHASNLYPEHGFQRTHMKHIVLEIKTQMEKIPDWLHDLTMEYSLKSLPHSKYSLGIEATQTDLFL